VCGGSVRIWFVCGGSVRIWFVCCDVCEERDGFGSVILVREGMDSDLLCLCSYEFVLHLFM